MQAATRSVMEEADSCLEGEIRVPTVDTEVSSSSPSSSRRRFLEQTIIGTAATAVTLATLTFDPEISLAEDASNDGMLSSSITTEQALLLADANSKSAVDLEGILKQASKKALGGGKAGAAAAVVQVGSLMWLRTAMNYQYRYGGNLQESLEILWKEGGIARLYQGLPFALVQGPLTRFGDTAANVGTLALLDSFTTTAGLPLPLRTAVGSITAGLWRIILMPIDTSKTTMQVDGSDGLNRLWQSVFSNGPSPLYQGSVASAAATAVGHFPWFLTYNFLNDALPQISKEDDLLLALARSALLGLSASCVSDVCSNSLRVIKTTKQTAGLTISKEGDNDNADADDGKRKGEITYKETLDLILEQDGWQGLFGRGLQTRLLTNAVQGSIFSVLW
eukprot:CAMPEP_0198300832 /NCGR_PEP_ID=MMETSP1449-20131203/49636_1 /TAXON_ID=420275 /ORGANISM="Attheya septentrionalis, Strain CCMP2084" /LENGTH=391 /DNA_ID=CAMNT_0044002761 /DNA_START=156 /DNA_END=1328 /DNA_ORIENTATION=+